MLIFFSPESAVADEDGDEELPEDEDIEIAALNRLVYRKSSPFLKSFERSLCHNWAKDGSHHSFKAYTTFQVDMQNLLGYTHSNGTGHRLMRLEIENYSKFCDKPSEAEGKVFLMRPNMQSQYDSYHESKTKLRQIREEPNESMFISHH
jgi:hypothetical protein